MSRSAITVQQAGPFAVGITQLTVTTTADSTNNHTLAGNDGKMMIIINNGSGAPATITAVGLASSLTFNNAPSVAVTVPAGKIGTLGPFTPGAFNQSDGSVNINSSVTSSSVTLSAVQTVATPHA
jgi:hypothetical protein